MYYRFYPGAIETDEAFTKEMNALTREIGERGKIKPATSPLAEGVPPAPAPAPAPEPAPEPAPAPAPARDASAATPPRAALPPAAALAPAGHSFSPSMQVSAAPTEHALAGVGIAELASFMREQQTRDDKNRAEMDAKMEAMRAEMQKQREELAPPPPQEAVSAQRLAALQARIEQLRAAQLLTDEEFFALEDLCADYLEVQTFAAGVLTQEVVGSNPAYGEVAKLAQLIAVSEGLASDAGFARQARRKFV
eukprot:COSAG04_NODE_1734_length_5755_cov_2.998762_4_plen_251_part_00